MNPQQSTVSQRIAMHLVEMRDRHLPDSAVDACRTSMLDTWMVSLAGSRGAEVDALTQLARLQGGRNESRAWGSNAALPATEAAFLNALSASALDFDSLHVNVHPDAIALSAAWAVAQREHSSGEELLRAFAAGSELICRLAQSVSGPQKGWTIGAVVGTFGAAAVAASLLKLDASRTANALGIALSTAAGSQQSNVEQTLTKRLQPALATRAGVYAALMAQAGISGPAEVFEGKFGLWSLYFPADEQRLLAGFGETFLLEQSGLKAYPVCACSHAAMEAFFFLQSVHRFSDDDIDHIEAVISPFMNRLVGRDFAPAKNPQVTAQFSLKYALAAIALRRKFGLSDLADAAVLDPAVAEMVKRISITVDDKNQHELAPASIRLQLRSGRSFEKTIYEMPGGPASRLTPAQLNMKYTECTDAAQGDRVRLLVQSIAGVSDVSKIEV